MHCPFMFISVIPSHVALADLEKPNLIKLLKPTGFMSLSFLSLVTFLPLLHKAGRSLELALKGVK